MDADRPHASLRIENAFEAKLAERPMKWGFYRPIIRDWLFLVAMASGALLAARWALVADIEWTSASGLAWFAFGAAWTMAQTILIACVTVGVVRRFREGRKDAKRSVLAATRQSRGR